MKGRRLLFYQCDSLQDRYGTGWHFRVGEIAVQAGELQRRLKSKYPPVVIDVRSGFEYRGGHIQGAVHAPLLKLMLRRVPLPEDRGAELVLTCEHGPRAQIAQGLLKKRGFKNVTLLEGHMSGWRSAGLNTEK